MSRILLSLVGELVMPNLLLMKTLTGVDQYVFLLPKMQKAREQARRLCSLCDIPRPQILEVDEYSLEDIDRALKSNLNDREQEYWVNLTTGSRIMALAAFEHFRQLNARILYLPPQTNSFQLLWPDHQEDHLPVTYKLDLDSCLLAHGVQVHHKSLQQREPSQLEAMFGIITKNSNSRFMSRLNRLGSEAKNTNEARSLAQLSEKFARALGISEREVLSPGWLTFIKGAWFEEYLAHWVSRVLDLAYHSVVVEKDGVQNELDCAFMRQNQLYIMELKASANIGDLNEFLYKLDSLGKDFGLRPRCFLAIADPDVERGLRQNRHYLRRADSMGIGILSYSQLLPQNIENTLRKLFGSEKTARQQNRLPSG